MSLPTPRAVMFAGGGLSQNLAYVGINVQSILYGVEVALYFKTMCALLAHKRNRKPYDKFYAIFSTVMILLITVWVVTETQYGKEIWLLSKFHSSQSTASARALLLACGTVSIIVLQLMTDALMIYRCWMLWDCVFIIFVPLILWVATLVLGILMAWSASTQGNEFLFGFASRLGLAYYSITVFLNIVSTGAICYHMVHLGRAVRILGHDYARVYFSVVALIIESMLPYTLAGIAFLVSLGLTSPTLVPFMSLYMMLMCLSSQLLIFRVSTRKAWQKGTSKPLRPQSAIKFSSVMPSQFPDARGATVTIERTMHVVSLPSGDTNV